MERVCGSGVGASHERDGAPPVTVCPGRLRSCRGDGFEEVGAGHARAALVGREGRVVRVWYPNVGTSQAGHPRIKAEANRKRAEAAKEQIAVSPRDDKGKLAVWVPPHNVATPAPRNYEAAASGNRGTVERAGKLAAARWPGRLPPSGEVTDHSPRAPDARR